MQNVKRRTNRRVRGRTKRNVKNRTKRKSQRGAGDPRASLARQSANPRVALSDFQRHSVAARQSMAEKRAAALGALAAEKRAAKKPSNTAILTALEKAGRQREVDAHAKYDSNKTNTAILTALERAGRQWEVDAHAKMMTRKGQISL